MAALAATWPRGEMQTRKLGKGEGVSHGGPTREGNPGWGRFLAWGVRPPVWVQGFQQPGAGNWAAFPWGNPAAWLPTFALPIAHTGAGGEIEAGGEGLHSRWREGQVDGFMVPGLGFVAEFQRQAGLWGPLPAAQALPCAGLGEGRAHLLPGSLLDVA